MPCTVFLCLHWRIVSLICVLLWVFVRHSFAWYDTVVLRRICFWYYVYSTCVVRKRCIKANRITSNKWNNIVNKCCAVFWLHLKTSSFSFLTMCVVVFVIKGNLRYKAAMVTLYILYKKNSSLPVCLSYPSKLVIMRHWLTARFIIHYLCGCFLWKIYLYTIVME